MKDRSAIDTIKGYYYQFDKTLIEIFNTEDGSVIIEGIEDIDISKSTEKTAIQCKYYAKSEYNNSKIKEPISLMLKDFANRKTKGDKLIKYHLYGHYKSGQDKLPKKINLTFLKDKLLTTRKKDDDASGTKDLSDKTKKTVISKLYDELHLSDDDLDEFIKLLSIDINAPSFEDQVTTIYELLSEKLECSISEEKDYYYCKCLGLIKNLSIQQDKAKRQITQNELIKHINDKEILFNEWFILKKGLDAYLKSIKNKFFKNRYVNTERTERFFLINVPNNYSIIHIRNVIHKISTNWRRYSDRNVSNDNICPYIFLNNIKNIDFIKLKNDLHNELSFIDGYSFKDASFDVDKICKPIEKNNSYYFKLIDCLEDLKKILKHVQKRKIIYQFSNSSFFFDHEDDYHIKIKIKKLTDLDKIL